MKKMNSWHKILIAAFAAALLAMMLTACGQERTPITYAQYEETCRDAGLDITEATGEYSSHVGLTEAYTAISEDNTWQVTYLHMKNSSDALNVYSALIADYELIRTGTRKQIENGNYKYYNVRSGDVYQSASLIEDTLILAEGNTSQKETMQDMVEKLGY